MIILTEVSKHYGTGANEIKAVDGISLHVAQGEFLILIGHSGSGKTTLLNLIAGMTRPDKGCIEIAGRDILSMSDAELAHFRAAVIGFVFQFQSMISTLTALNNVRLPALFRRHRSERSEALASLDRVGLAGRENAYAHELSLGQQRRVGIARALISSPSLLLCDEPTGDLDPETEQIIMELIVQANRNGTTVVMATHNHDLCTFADRVLRMDHGRIDPIKG
ncbi:ABC transporter ATP-binding protein [Bacteroides graminisolvens]|uniref:ABC transporter ATP-binding protein n=1 Tax=Bacteroides graminisolvens TaxID=477666 RepID=UPI0029C996AF|nr:ABC transporter ATP-binding protein [Bacteroides graminisolvens]